MRIGTERVGPRGLALLAATAIAATLLAVHGWAGRGSGLAPGSLAAGGPARGQRGHGQATPARAASGARTPARASAPAGAPRAAPGPLLSSEPYASYAFRVWPGSPAPSARLAMTGLRVSVRRHGTGLLVAAGLAGQPLPAPHLYSAGARVYVVEVSLGDDSGGTDYNLGDDGLVVTNAQGRLTS
jgi:hypothetical protein